MKKQSGIMKPRYEFQFKPESEGQYTYIFKRFGDINYPNGKSINLSPITQTFHPHSYAQFNIPYNAAQNPDQPFKVQRCINQQVELEIKVQGSGI